MRTTTKITATATAVWGTLVGLALLASTPAAANGLSPAEVLKRTIDHDPWAMGGAKVKAQLVLTDKSGSKKELAFTAQSLSHEPPLSKSLVRFTAPAQLRGAGFLQVQKKDADDDRFLFLPELGRARRISGNLRSTAFMGTDFSFADLDRRDLREGKATLGPDVKIDGVLCYSLTVITGRSDSEYSRIELSVAKETFLPLRMAMYDRSQARLKSFTAQKTERVGGQWFITRSLMVNERHAHSSLLTLYDISVTELPGDAEFSLRRLERP
jgi:uncharacterized protein